jgi:hypothetical protein
MYALRTSWVIAVQGGGMDKRGFPKEIERFVLANWEQAIHEAEEKFAKHDVGTSEHIYKIKEFAQLRIISGLVEVKGAWLSVIELQYALDLFGRYSAEIDYFHILTYQNSGVLGEFRQLALMEDSEGGLASKPQSVVDSSTKIKLAKNV